LDAGQIYPEPIRIDSGWCILKVKEKKSLNNLVRKTMALEKQRDALEKLRDEAVIVYDKDLFPGGLESGLETTTP